MTGYYEKKHGTSLPEFVNEWGEPVDEAKSVGELYHMTLVGQILYMGHEDFVFYSNRLVSSGTAYEGQYFISTTRNPRLKFYGGESEEDNYARINCNARIVIDGDKLSEKYQVFPFADLESGSKRNATRPLSTQGGEFEEAILIPKEMKNHLPMKPFIKRVDIYDDPTIPNYDAKYIPLAIEQLKKHGIPYKMVPKFWR
jgi:hypothetical protein